jgi:Fur family transcriptional regulator, peroxide stress response regulator
VSKLQVELTEALRGSALRCTPQRYAVLEFLAARPVHATAQEILTAINRRDPQASRATVYNSLHALVRAGLVREVAADGKSARFDANLRRHHHFVCEVCGELEDIAWFDLPPAAGRRGLGARQVSTYEVVFRGACERCAARAKGERS